MQYILNADDFGRTETVNEAIVYGFDHHFLDRTSIMVNMPYFEEAVTLSEQHGFKDKVGLHINLTSGIPLTEPIKTVNTFCGENGYFNGRIFKDRRMMLILSHREKKAVKLEVDAQIKKYLDYGFTLMHADSHGHVHTFPSMQKTILECISNNSFQSVRISANLHHKGISMYKKIVLNYRLFNYNRLRGGKVTYFDSYKSVYNSLFCINQETGKCEIMLHPNIYAGDMQIGEGLHYDDLIQVRNYISPKSFLNN